MSLVELPNKKELTRRFLEEAQLLTDEPTVKKYLWLWWKNPINQTSLRLTEQGYTFLTETLNLTSYHYVTTDPAAEITPKFLLALDRNITVPFYLKTRRDITFFGEESAIMLALHGNSLKSYVASMTFSK